MIININGKYNNRQSLQLVMPHKDPVERQKWCLNHERKNKDVVNARHRKYYKNDPLKEKKRKLIQYFKLKLEVFCHYSKGIPNCKICNEENLNYLSIDHIKGGGNKHRKLIKLFGGGVHFYRWLIKNGLPEGFQVLCFNHNQAKRFEERGRINCK